MKMYSHTAGSVVPAIIFFVFWFTASGFSQELRIRTSLGFVFDHSINTFADNTNFYRGRINGGFNWGIGLESKFDNFNAAVLNYFRQETMAPLKYYSGGLKETNFGLNLNYILAGINRYFGKPNSKIEYFGGTQLGACIAYFKNPDTRLTRSFTRLALGLSGGLNTKVNDILSLNFQANLLSVVEALGGGIFIGPGGSGTTISTYSSIFQFGFSAGFIVKIR